MRAPVAVCLVVVAALLSVSCGPPVDLTKALEIKLDETGWFDAGIINGQNKLVPSITFTLKNNSEKNLTVLQVNALFKRVTENDEWGSAFVTVAGSGSQGLAPGATTAPITIRSNLGYTGSDQSRVEMLQNSHFVDAKVQLFAKYGSAQWTRIGEFPIARQLLAK